MNKQEYLHNLSYVGSLAVKNFIPVYLNPQEYLEFEFPQFVMLQLYYAYCNFQNQNPTYDKSNWP